jgi:hypothetical protein
MTLPKVTVDVEPGADPFRPLTHAELDHALTVARRVRLAAKVYEQVEIEWQIDPRFNALMIITRADVFPRDARPEDSEDDRLEAYLAHVPPEFGCDLRTLRNVRPNFAAPQRLPVKGGKPIRLTSGMIWGPVETLLDYLANEARQALREMVWHEVDELLLVDDERCFDPHRNEFMVRVKP